MHYVLRGIRRSQSTTHRRTRLPITSGIMRAIQVAVFSPARECSELERHLLWTACCLGFFGFLRSGEFTVKNLRQETPLLFSDMAIDSHIQPSTIRLHIRKAKSDPFGNGVFIFRLPGERRLPRIKLRPRHAPRPSTSAVGDAYAQMRIRQGWAW